MIEELIRSNPKFLFFWNITNPKNNTHVDITSPREYKVPYHHGWITNANEQ